MTELFYDDGHLTDDALRALLSGAPLDELERLEISEHLSFCDACVARYAALLADSPLLSPEQPVAPAVLQRIRERARKLFLSKYTTVVAAASFAIVFWNIGVFNIDIDGGSKMLNALNASVTSISERTTAFTDNLSQTVSQLIHNLNIERGTNDHGKK